MTPILYYHSISLFPLSFKNQRIPTVYRLIEYNDYSVMFMQRAPQTLLVCNESLKIPSTTDL